MLTAIARTRTVWARGRRATGVAFFMLVLAAGGAQAGTYANSNSPYWKVGTYNERLTKACRRGVFNQVKVNTYNIHYVGDKGRSVTGIAKKGWNLSDPRGYAEDGYTYHFFNDGYSNCRVYMAK